MRSISRPAGTALRPEATRKIAGPSPSSPSTPVTSTNVIDETAATSWSTAEYTAMAAASSTVLRRTGRWVAVVAKAGILSRAVCHAVATGNWKAVRRLLPMLLAAGSLLAFAGPASATTLSDAFTGACPTYGDIQVCSGSVPSFDGSKLDVDLTLPTGGGGRHPLIVMLHGFGNNKREWESTTDAGDGADKYEWNSHWFARHGYYVLTYTARGFRDDGPTGDYEPDTPGDPSGSAGPPQGTIKVKSRDFEIRDTQW